VAEAWGLATGERGPEGSEAVPKGRELAEGERWVFVRSVVLGRKANKQK